MLTIIRPLPSADIYARQLDGVCNAMMRCNFSIGIELLGFEIPLHQEISTALLTQLIIAHPLVAKLMESLKKHNSEHANPERLYVAGTFIPVTFDQFQDTIERSFSWSDVNPISSSIKTIIFDIIQRALVHKIDYILEHNPAGGSYFDSSGVFTFCFIVVAKNHGIIISGISSD